MVRRRIGRTRLRRRRLRLVKGVRRFRRVGRIRGARRRTGFYKVVTFNTSKVFSRNPGGWQLDMFAAQYPTAYLSIYKEFKILGAYVSVKRHRPSPISFSTGDDSNKTNYAQVEHQELWWYPSSGDDPTLPPRQISKAVLVGDNWTTRYIPNMVATATTIQSWSGQGGQQNVWAKKRCPWLPVDFYGGEPVKQTLPQQIIGYFYVDGNNLGIEVEYDVEARLKVAFRYRKDLVMHDPNPDTSGAHNTNSGGHTVQYPEQIGD